MLLKITKIFFKKIKILVTDDDCEYRSKTYRMSAEVT